MKSYLFKRLFYAVLFLTATGMTPLLARNSSAEETADELEDLRREVREMRAEQEARERQLEAMEERLTEMEIEPEEEVPVYIEPGRPDGAAKLPDISLIGDIRGEFGPGRDDNVFLDELELAIGGFLYPQIRADTYIALDKHGNDYEVELEEAYISFLDLGAGFAAQAGKKLIGFGKLNPIHEHAWDFVSRPLVLAEYLDDHDGLAGNGVNLTWLAPLPWFLQLEAGVWDLADEGGGDDEHGHDHATPISGSAVSRRLWSGFAVGDNGDLELGFSTIHGKGDHHEQERDRVSLYGMDLTYTWRGHGFQRLLWRNEVIYNDRERATHYRRTWGFYSAANWRCNQYWDTGLRYDWVEPSTRDPQAQDMGTATLTRSLTEETHLRFEFSHDFSNDYMATLQFIFGLGPHAHPLE